MFPSNLHRNIVQLDRQISLLENECKNIEAEKKRKSFKPESSYSTISKISSTRLKSPTVKAALKKTDSSIRTKKPIPSISARLPSVSSLSTHTTKPWNEVGSNLVGKKKKPCGLSRNVQVSPCLTSGSPHYSKNDNHCVKCICFNEMPTSDISNNSSFEESKKDHVLHKELVFPNSGGAIEVTVTQKSNNEKENSPVIPKPIMRSSNSESQINKDLEGCKCQVRGQKWSEILCEKSSRRKESNTGDSMKNKFQTDEIQPTYTSVNFKSTKKVDGNCPYENNKNNMQKIQQKDFEVPVKLNIQISEANKRQTELNSNKFEKETQYDLENCCNGDSKKEFKVPEKIFRFLLYICQQMPYEILNKLPIDVETVSIIKGALTEICEENKNNRNVLGQSNSVHINAVERHCESLMKEKTLLSQEIMAKDNAIAIMRKREDEYLSLIESLKASLEKTKGNVQEGIDAVKETNIIKSKLLEQMKVSEALKKSHLKLQEILEKCSLENDRLKTQIKIFQLEAQKHEVLLAGKDVEIKRYREEIQNFQQQISDHLAALKSSAQEINVEKMMEAIIQQSQIFTHTDLDSLLEKDQKDCLKEQNIMLHSSPTSTKTSILNSSWKQISSIHDHDQDHEQSKANSDVVIYLNDENNSKDFFQVFGKNSSELITPKKSKKSAEKLSVSDKKDVKHSSSFTSFLSANDDHNSSKSSNRDSLISKGSLISGGDKSDEQLRKSSRVSFDKPQTTVDELLKNMKLKFSKEIFETSLPTYTTEDLLDISQISSISPL